MFINAQENLLTQDIVMDGTSITKEIVMDEISSPEKITGYFLIHISQLFLQLIVICLMICCMKENKIIISLLIGLMFTFLFSSKNLDLSTIRVTLFLMWVVVGLIVLYSFLVRKELDELETCLEQLEKLKSKLEESDELKSKSDEQDLGLQSKLEELKPEISLLKSKIDGLQLNQSIFAKIGRFPIALQKQLIKMFGKILKNQTIVMTLAHNIMQIIAGMNFYLAIMFLWFNKEKFEETPVTIVDSETIKPSTVDNS